MLKSFKYRIYPTDDQIIKLSNIFGQVRFVYNLGLETKINAWKSHKKSISTFDLNNQIKDLKNWFKFKTMLEYKCEWYGKNLSIIGRFDPSSKTCSSCGSKNNNLKLSDREWV